MRIVSLALLGACSMASVALAAPPASDEDLLLEIQRHFPAAKKWFGMVADLEWERSADGARTPVYEGMRSPFVRPRDAAGHRLRVKLPKLSTEPHEVWIDGKRELSVRTVELTLAPVEAEELRGMIVYRGALEGGDLLYKLTPTHVDEYVYYRQPPTKLRRELELELGSGVRTLRQAGRLIEVIGKDGAAVLRLGAPFARAADGTRREGVVRVEGARVVSELDLTGLRAPILVDPDWETTGSMTVAHWADLAFRLPDGAVMSVAGCALASCPIGLASSFCNQVLSVTDLWSPRAGSWTAGPSLAVARYSYAGAQLASGDIVIAGGCTRSECAATTASAERYSVAEGRWVPAGSLPRPLANAVAVTLAGGDVLVVGGCDEQSCFGDVSRYEAARGAWRAVASLAVGRGHHSATALPDGRVMVTGGCADAACARVLAGAEVYDPAEDRWKPAGGMTTPRASHTATALDDGSVLVAGGCSEQACKAATLSSAELWSPDGSFTRVAPMNAPRHHHTATRMDNGQILVAGGTDRVDATHASADVYLPNRRQFVATPRMLMSRAYHTAAPLLSGEVIIAGGCNPATCLPWGEVFTPEGLPSDPPDAGPLDAGPAVDHPDASVDYGPPVAARGGPHPRLFRTGALGCSTDEVQDLPCPIAGWPSQDGDLQPSQRPMLREGEETKDLVTGLVWRSRDDGRAYTQAAAEEACRALSTPRAGAGEWRLPSVLELATINHYGKIGPSTDQAFETQPTNYWSATRVAGSQSLGWTVKFDAGELVPVLRDTEHPIRCVRGTSAFPQLAPGSSRLAGAFTATPLTVRDPSMGLEWQRRDEGTRRSWRESLEYCDALTLDGKDDWHLPNVFELLSLIEFGSTERVKIDPVFQNTQADLYWTSTFSEGIPTLSWSVTFNLGVVDGVTYSGRALSRCVRHEAPQAKPGSGCGCSSSGGGDGALALGLLLALGLRRRARAAAFSLVLASLGCTTTPAASDCTPEGACPDGQRCFPDWRCRPSDATASCDPPCYGELPLCDPSTLRCAACLGDADCGAGTLCATWLGRCVPGCSATHPSCAEEASRCDVSAGVCRGCRADAECTDPARPRCDGEHESCVACLPGDACGEGEYCGALAGSPACVSGCLDDAGCAGQGESCCGHLCVDVMRDVDHCAGCGLPCGAGLACCGGRCVDLTRDPESCGACDRSCVLPNVAGIACIDSSCVRGACESYFEDCDRIPSNGCEVNLTRDPNNCYRCGQICAARPNAEPACTVSGCSLGPCLAGWANCDRIDGNGCEYDARDFASDPANCGACGVTCARCVDGRCA